MPSWEEIHWLGPSHVYGAGSCRQRAQWIPFRFGQIELAHGLNSVLAFAPSKHWQVKDGPMLAPVHSAARRRRRLKFEQR